MIRCVHLWTGADGRSHFAEGRIALAPGVRGDQAGSPFPLLSASFQVTESDPKLGWHVDPARQLVITLSGEIGFYTADGHFDLTTGDVLFTEDLSGRGHD